MAGYGWPTPGCTDPYDAGPFAVAPPLPVSAAPAAADDDLELNDEIVALFAGMEQRRAARCAGGRASSAKSRRSTDMQLPAQEDAASRAAQRDRREGRQRQQRLYGEHASEVRAREAVLNASFDRAVRNLNPPPWPSAPLR
jgi:hypothetical protein